MQDAIVVMTYGGERITVIQNPASWKYGPFTLTVKSYDTYLSLKDLQTIHEQIGELIEKVAAK